jgi:4-hydroxybenzoate polyprenyltransferase
MTPLLGPTSENPVRDSVAPLLDEPSQQLMTAHSTELRAVSSESLSLWARLKAYASIARPDHWGKNVFMLVGSLLACFYHQQTLGLDALLWVGLGLVATCIIASSNYVLNEILDAPTDAHHPVKRNRPIPSGLVYLPLAYAEWILLGAAGLALAYAVNRPFFAMGALLLVMGLIYNVRPIRAKDLPYVDVMTEAVNNPIRLMLGWFVISPVEMPPVSLLLSYWMLGAFFMASKRLAEYRALGSPTVAAAYRASFRHYTQQGLLVSMFFYANVFALFLGIFIIRYHLELILIVPLVAGFMSYYLAIALKPNSSAMAPERLYRERGLMVYLLIGLCVFLALMLVHIPALYDWFNVKPSGVPPLWRF